MLDDLMGSPQQRGARRRWPSAPLVAEVVADDSPERSLGGALPIVVATTTNNDSSSAPTVSATAVGAAATVTGAVVRRTAAVAVRNHDAADDGGAAAVAVVVGGSAVAVARQEEVEAGLSASSSSGRRRSRERGQAMVDAGSIGDSLLWTVEQERRLPAGTEIITAFGTTADDALRGRGDGAVPQQRQHHRRRAAVDAAAGAPTTTAITPAPAHGSAMMIAGRLESRSRSSRSYHTQPRILHAAEERRRALESQSRHWEFIARGRIQCPQDSGAHRMARWASSREDAEQLAWAAEHYLWWAWVVGRVKLQQAQMNRVCPHGGAPTIAFTRTTTWLVRPPSS